MQADALGVYDCLVTNACGGPGVASNAVTLSFAAVPPSHCPADLGVQGGGPGHDSLLDNNDFIAFIDHFFNGCP